MNILLDYSFYNLICYFTYGFVTYIFLQDIYIDIKICKCEYKLKYEWNIFVLGILSMIFIMKKIYYFYLFIILAYFFICDKLNLLFSKLLI